MHLSRADIECLYVNGEKGESDLNQQESTNQTTVIGLKKPLSKKYSIIQ